MAKMKIINQSNLNTDKKDKKDSTVFDDLAKLWRTGTLMKDIGKKKINIDDIDKLNNQDTVTNLTNKLNGIWSKSVPRPTYTNVISRKLKYLDYEVMDKDSIISSGLDIYAEECSLKDDLNDIITIETENKKIKDELNNLFDNVLNIEFNLFPWIRNLCKYGDFFLILEIDQESGITDVFPMSVYDIQRMDKNIEKGPREGKRKIKYELLNGVLTKSLENYEVIHFRLLNDTNDLPYGKSILESGRRVWKQLKLMEDAMLVYRIMRAPERRIFYVNVGGINKKDVRPYMEKFISSVKKEPIIDKKTGELDLKYNVQNTLEDFFMPVRGNETSTRIETLPGGDNNQSLEDISYLQNKLFTSLKIPKSFLQFEESMGAKSNLQIEDIRFSRSVERIQRVVEAELRKLAIIHLFTINSIDNNDILDFEIRLTRSSTTKDMQMIEILNDKLGIIRDAKQDGTFSVKKLMKMLFQYDNTDYEEYKKEIALDAKFKYELEQISMEGEMPDWTKEKDSDMADADVDVNVDVDVDNDADDDDVDKNDDDDDKNDDDNNNKDKSDNDEDNKKSSNKKDKKTTTGVRFDTKRSLGNKPSLKASKNLDDLNNLGIVINETEIINKK